jgi:hypothetical protein
MGRVRLGEVGGKSSDDWRGWQGGDLGSRSRASLSVSRDVLSCRVSHAKVAGSKRV